MLDVCVEYLAFGILGCNKVLKHTLGKGIPCLDLLLQNTTNKPALHNILVSKIGPDLHMSHSIILRSGDPFCGLVSLSETGIIGLKS